MELSAKTMTPKAQGDEKEQVPVAAFLNASLALPLSSSSTPPREAMGEIDAALQDLVDAEKEFRSSSGHHSESSKRARCNGSFGSKPPEPNATLPSARALNEVHVGEPLDSLHMACKNPDVTVQEIARLTNRDPSAATRPVVLKARKTIFSHLSYQCETKLVNETYSYPLHLAIHHHASTAVVARLAELAPSILALKDGPQEETPLMVLLKKPSHLVNIDLINFLILEDPAAVRLRDRHGNTVLHKAIVGGVQNVEIVKHLVLIFPLALHHRNFHQSTPLRLCQQRTSFSGTSEEVLDFLHDKTNEMEIERDHFCFFMFDHWQDAETVMKK